MLIDARELDEGRVIEADLCIVGAGPAGITIARELAGSPLDIVLVESGGFEPDAATQGLYDAEMPEATFVDGFDPEREIPLVGCRLRYFGGTSNHWAGFCRPLRPVDFERRPHLPLSGWPFPRETLVPFYERAQEVIQLGPFRYEWEDWVADGLPEPLIDDGTLETSAFQIRYPFAFGEVYRDQLVGAANVRVLTWANVTRLGVAAESDVVEVADIATLDGITAQVRARAFVVSTGGTEVPRLLLASNDVRTAGLGNGRDLVGRHFVEHLLVPGGYATLVAAPEDLHHYDEGIIHRVEGAEEPAVVKAFLHLSDETIRTRELLGLELQVNLTAGEPVQSDGVDTAVVNRLIDAVEGPTSSIVYLQVAAEQVLNPENRVVLSSEADDLGMPQAELRWRPGDEDVASIRAGLAIAAGRLARAGLGRMQAVPDGIRRNESGIYETVDLDADGTGLVDRAAVGFHHMCTTRMAVDPAKGVVDPDCKVHDLANLYVGGSAAFATGGASTPTLTIVALALRLADHLRDRVLA